MATCAKAPAFFESPRIYAAYPKRAADGFHRIFALDATPREHLLATARGALRDSGVPMRKLAKDGWAAVRGFE